MRLTTRWRSIALSAGLALAFAAAVAAGAFAIVTGLTPAATPPTLPREALLIERTPSPVPPALEPVTERATAPSMPPKPSLREAEPRSAAPEPRETDAAVVPPARPTGPPRRTAPRVDMAALPSEPPQVPSPAPAPLRRAAPEPPRLTAAPVLRPRADPRMEGVLTPDEVRRIRIALRLTPEQTPHWPPVEALLQEIGAQQVALVKAGHKAEDAFGSSVSMRIYWAARPLLGVLREDQKARIRARARALGLEAVASAI
ncbi:hypothetical protein [Methylobacterium sp. J-090]|uniref:hypothetical protein n=1 Tax=Methylobacterium sp. J-090 TaxID=2836666 RepID=UPI001FBAAAC0|nr:hypothetical protein [Methylobacterium sp. J-090]MCJ2081701.1 hypothetical protein [Methylobacterium sp. J-090]